MCVCIMLHKSSHLHPTQMAMPLKEDKVSHLWLDTVEEQELVAACPRRWIVH